MNEKNFYSVILAGGTGKRLKKLSSEENPKQFLSFDDKQTFLEQAIDRVSLLVDKKNIFVSTNKRYKKKIEDSVGKKIGGMILEPAKRNTAPAILLSCLRIYKKNKNAVILFCPSDSFIPNKNDIITFFEKSFEYAQNNDQIVLFGLKPQRAATEYGYIEYKIKKKEPFSVKCFYEKPNFYNAKEYIKKSNMLWNIGMFCAKVSVFIKAFQKYSPELFFAVNNYIDGKGLYEDVFAISIDYAVIEKSKNIKVFPVSFKWYDIGNVEIFLHLEKKYNKQKNKL